MDGLLINTEDIYTEVTNELLAEHGKGPLSWDVKITLQGRPGADVSRACPLSVHSQNILTLYPVGQAIDRCL